MTKKISQLPAATSVDTNDEFVINQDGTTKKLTTANQWDFANVNIDGGSITGITDIAVSDGGTGASNASGARTNLGLGNVDNVSAANLRDRSTHTGTQPLSTISDAGNMGLQNKESVNIDGGTIDGTAVNATNLAYSGTLTGGTGVVNLGSGQVVKDASGNVGIGTTSPGARLDVVSDGSAVAAHIRCRTVNDFGFLRFRSFDGTESLADIVVNRTATNTGNLQFRTNNGGTDATERMRIDSSGHVGIGTTSPTEALHIDGQYRQTRKKVFVFPHAGPQNGQTIQIDIDFKITSVLFYIECKTTGFAGSSSYGVHTVHKGFNGSFLATPSTEIIMASGISATTMTRVDANTIRLSIANNSGQGYTTANLSEISVLAQRFNQSQVDPIITVTIV